MSDQKNEIAALNEKLLLVKEERNKLNLEAKKWVEKRNALHKKIKNSRKDASKIKEQRDSLNIQVQELKNLRNQINVKGKEKSNQISKLEEKINQLDEKKSFGNMRHTVKQIEEIDWKIQTNSFPLKEEQELVNQVRQLEKKLKNQKQVKKLKNQLFELRKEQRNFVLEAKKIHERLSELAESSQKLHTQMVETLEKACEQQSEADEVHKKYIETKEKAQQKHQNFVELVGKIKAIQQKLKENADRKQAIRQGELKQELEERALAKMKNGEKLLWEEFQILAEKGLV